jgi:putative transposase
MSVGKRYVQHINRTDKRTGTLWDSRYKSSLIDAESDLMACMRHIELKPGWAWWKTGALPPDKLPPQRAGQGRHALHRTPALHGAACSRQRPTAANCALCQAELDHAAVDAIRLALKKPAAGRKPILCEHRAIDRRAT